MIPVKHFFAGHPGKDVAALIGFPRKLKRGKAKPLAVAMALPPAYMRAVRQVFPDVDIVHDPYHVVTLVNDAIDETPRFEPSAFGSGEKCHQGQSLPSVNGTGKAALARLGQAQCLIDVNQPLFQAYPLKEALREFWRLGSKTKGRAFLLAWIDQALPLGNPHFAKLAKTLALHMDGMLSYFRHTITTGPTEGLNNKIKTL